MRLAGLLARHFTWSGTRSLLAFLMTLFLALSGFLGLTVALRSFGLPLRPWRLLLGLGHSLLALRPLLLGVRATLLRHSLSRLRRRRRHVLYPRWLDGRTLRLLRPIVLLHNDVVRLVSVVLVLQRLLLLHARIAIA